MSWMGILKAPPPMQPVGDGKFAPLSFTQAQSIDESEEKSKNHDSRIMRAHRHHRPHWKALRGRSICSASKRQLPEKYPWQRNREEQPHGRG